MKKALLTIFFLVFAYPGVLIYQAIAGGFVGFFVALALGTNAGARSTGLLGVLGFIVAGFIVYLTCRPKKTLNDKASVVLMLVLATSALLSCQQLPAKVAYEPTEEELFPAPPMKTDSAGWTGPKLVFTR